ncbi:hypothetical protein OsJ_29273 [Oryza sativa Japonica Group]|uniref:Uncharacterized protein n=3 Tax=Oryza sativa TaxID=4530 RepID=B9G3G2_ORYSJ|nr:hypothetical protein OsJ_29273 [Oryza sativa Japonica Group]
MAILLTDYRRVKQLDFGSKFLIRHSVHTLQVSQIDLKDKAKHEESKFQPNEFVRSSNDRCNLASSVKLKLNKLLQAITRAKSQLYIREQKMKRGGSSSSSATAVTMTMVVLLLVVAAASLRAADAAAAAPRRLLGADGGGGGGSPALVSESKASAGASTCTHDPNTPPSGTPCPPHN